jgi:hypothetical protein
MEHVWFTWDRRERKDIASKARFHSGVAALPRDFLRVFMWQGYQCAGSDK